MRNHSNDRHEIATIVMDDDIAEIVSNHHTNSPTGSCFGCWFPRIKFCRCRRKSLTQRRKGGKARRSKGFATADLKAIGLWPMMVVVEWGDIKAKTGIAGSRSVDTSPEKSLATLRPCVLALNLFF